LQPSKDDILALIEASNALPTGQLALKTRAKLTLSYHDLECSIGDINQSIITLERLQQAVSRRHEVTSSSTDRKAAKLASSLQVAREHAISLYSALVNGWKAGCHQDHEAKMYLDGSSILGNREDAKQSYFRKQPPHSFKIILTSKDTNASGFWHESTVEVLEGDDSSNMPVPGPVALGSRRPPQVSIVAPVSISPGGTITLVDVPNLCTTIDKAAKERKLLRWYLASQQRIQWRHEYCISVLPSQRCHTVNLEEVLKPPVQVGSPPKIGLKNRMLLALNLASTLLKLQGTPWLTNSWSKKAIEFLKRPGTPPTASLVIDYQHPVISQHFPKSSPNPTPTLPPKVALLELGIMLLELWHETTLEAYYSTIPLGQSPLLPGYWSRLMIASIWLDDPTDQPLPLYHTAISQCVKCFFGGNFASPSWDDPEFRKALCKDLVEPLFESCKQWM
jgi:hypothetical protein